MKNYDYLIVGAGFAGSVLAERLANTGKKVLVIDKRNHLGGNCYDYYDKYGVLVHKYGPHCFHTDSKIVLDYLSKFTKWRKFELRVKAFVDNELYPIPINRDTLNMFFKINLRDKEKVEKFLKTKKENIKNPKNAEEYLLGSIGRELYGAFFKNYTKKQWGLHPRELNSSVVARIPLRTNTDDRYFNDKYQVMPKQSYAKIFENLLKKVKVILNTDFKKIKNKISYDKLIYTGPIDEFFNYKYGKLPYRSLKFKFENFNQEYYQTWSQIKYPNNHKFTRIVEIKHATGQKSPDTTVVKEYPSSNGEPFYPIPTKKNHKLYEKYKKEADKLKNVIFVGRLAQYKYLNMDQSVENSLNVFKRLK